MKFEFLGVLMEDYAQTLGSTFVKGEIESYITAAMLYYEWFYGDSVRVTAMNLGMHLLNISADCLH